MLILMHLVTQKIRKKKEKMMKVLLELLVYSFLGYSLTTPQIRSIWKILMCTEILVSQLEPTIQKMKERSKKSKLVIQ